MYVFVVLGSVFSMCVFSGNFNGLTYLLCRFLCVFIEHFKGRKFRLRSYDGAGFNCLKRQCQNGVEENGIREKSGENSGRSSKVVWTKYV